jgi:hypothetical protein
MVKLLPLILALTLAGCVNVSIQCPDKISTVTYKGLSLTGATSVSCVGSPAGGDVVQVSGMDLTALAAELAPLVAVAVKRQLQAEGLIAQPAAAVTPVAK